MNNAFKIGDWVKKPYWKDFYRISDVDYIQLHVQDGNWYPWYFLDDEFIKKEKDIQENPISKIELGKKYRRVGTHEPVRVICIDRKAREGAPWCVGLYQSKFTATEEVIHFDIYGCSPNGVRVIEEVPAVNWSKVGVDTPMWMCTFGEGPWHKRHFNKFENGRVHYWPNGYTSFTCNATSDINSDKPENCSLEEPV